MNAQAKDSVIMEVTVNVENISYTWLKNGVEIRSTDRCQTRCKQLSHTLSIRNVHFGDNAEYTFISGSAKSSARLYVEGERLRIGTRWRPIMKSMQNLHRLGLGPSLILFRPGSDLVLALCIQSLFVYFELTENIIFSE